MRSAGKVSSLAPKADARACLMNHEQQTLLMVKWMPKGSSLPKTVPAWQFYVQRGFRLETETDLVDSEWTAGEVDRRHAEAVL